MKKRSQAINTLWTVILTILSLAWVYPVVVVLINSFKKDSAISTNTAFQLPPADGFAGLGNYANAIHSKGFLAAFFNSFIISVTSKLFYAGTPRNKCIFCWEILQNNRGGALPRLSAFCHIQQLRRSSSHTSS